MGSPKPLPSLTPDGVRGLGPIRSAGAAPLPRRQSKNPSRPALGARQKAPPRPRRAQKSALPPPPEKLFPAAGQRPWLSETRRPPAPAAAGPTREGTSGSGGTRRGAEGTQCARARAEREVGQRTRQTASSDPPSCFQALLAEAGGAPRFPLTRLPHSPIAAGPAPRPVAARPQVGQPASPAGAGAGADIDRPQSSGRGVTRWTLPSPVT